MRFLGDMGVSHRVIAWLSEQGHDAKHLRSESLHQLEDEAIFAKAIEERRVLLTCDLDFAEIAAFAKGMPVSVVVFRMHNTRPEALINRFADVLEHSSAALETGAVISVEESRYRVRYLPIGGE